MWEVGQLDESFLSDIEKGIESKEDLAVLEELGADKSFIKQRTAHLEKFLKKISVKKEKPKRGLLRLFLWKVNTEMVR